MKWRRAKEEEDPFDDDLSRDEGGITLFFWALALTAMCGVFVVYRAALYFRGHG